MKDSTKRILLIGGSLLVIGGVAYYFLVYKPNHPKKDDNENEGELPPDETLNNAPSGITPLGTTKTPSELNSTDKIKAFQDWMDTIGPWVKGSDGKYKLLNKGAGYGTYGPSTAAAWDYYKDTYLKSPIHTETSVASDKELKSAMEFLVYNWAGDKAALKKRLLSEKRDFVIKWADAAKKLQAKKLLRNAFSYSQGTYDVVYGKKRTSDNLDDAISVKNANWKTYLDGKLRETPSSSSSSIDIGTKVSLGPIKDYRWNISENLMYVYVPDNKLSGRYKWIYWGYIGGYSKL